jgi:hypothetical protein
MRATAVAWDGQQFNSVYERGKLTHIFVRNVSSRFALGFDNVVCLLCQVPDENLLLL